MTRSDPMTPPLNMNPGSRLRRLFTSFSLQSLAFGLVLSVLPGFASAAPAPSRGLWVGEVTVNKVNQVGVDAYLQAGVVPPGPEETTPTASAAHFRLIVHVDANGQARLLKSVAVFGQTNSGGASISLVTDPSLYPQFTGTAKRISAVTFDFGELSVYQAITNVAGAAATKAAAAATPNATLAAITTAANFGVSQAISNAVNTTSPVSSNYYTFIASSQFTGPAAAAAAAAAQAAYQASTNSGATPQAIYDQASSAALIAMNGGPQEASPSAFKGGDALTRNEVPMDGSLAAGNAVSASFFLGAFHPTNPFYHRRHPDHRQGYDIIRTLQLVTDAAPTNSVSGGFGVDRLTGVYREEVHGLHKPLGPGRDIGLKTEGVFTLNRLSLVDILNQ